MTAGESEQQDMRREAIRAYLEDQPVAMAGDVGDELDVSRKTARRYLKDMEADNDSVRSTRCSGGRVWFVESDGDIPPLGQVEHHFRSLWSDSRHGRTLIVGLCLTAVVAALSTISLSFDTAGWYRAHERLQALVRVLSVCTWPMLIGPAAVLQHQGRLIPRV
jgi:hypothetical protein